jgi:hypothetical protein
MYNNNIIIQIFIQLFSKYFLYLWLMYENVRNDFKKTLLDIVMVFSARMYGSRCHKNKQIVQQLKDIANSAL